MTDIISHRIVWHVCRRKSKANIKAHSNNLKCTYRIVDLELQVLVLLGQYKQYAKISIWRVLNEDLCASWPADNQAHTIKHMTRHMALNDDHELKFIYTTSDGC